MTLSIILLIGLCASVLSVVIFAYTLMFTRQQQRVSPIASCVQTYDTYRAVMTVWYQVELQLNELEEDGVEVTDFRHNLATTVEQVLVNQMPNQFLDDRGPSQKRRARQSTHSRTSQNTTPTVVGQFGSFRIFG